MADFRRERVYFQVTGQGSIEWEAEVGVETPIEAFRRFVDDDSPSKLTALIGAASMGREGDFEYVITCSTEPPAPNHEHEHDYDRRGVCRRCMRTWEAVVWLNLPCVAVPS